ncbi:MAG: hypothetical protein ACOZCL_04075 [Bacillota bacterium]
MTILEKGKIFKNVGNSKVAEDYIIRLTEDRELNAVIELQNTVYEQLPNKQVLYRDSYAEMREDLESGAKIIGVYNQQNDLIAYRYFSFPGKNEKNLGYDINMPEDELESVVHLETTVVHPLYRGNDLQSITLQHAVSFVRPMGFKHLLCTVSPQNFYSLYNIMKNGLKIKSLKKKYGVEADQKDGLWRFILHRNLETVYEKNPLDILSLKLNELERQRTLIDDGYIGFSIIKESRMLNYAKQNCCMA